MDLTFAFRRKMIVEGVGIGELLETYPWMQSYQEILKEFKRLKPNTSSDDMEELLTAGLQKYRNAIINVLNGKKKPGFLSEMEATKVVYRTESQRNYADDCITLVGLPLLFKEKPEKVICSANGEPENSIAIVFKQKILSMDENSFSFQVEGNKIFECDNFVQAFVGCMAAIYVFNLAYPKEWTKTLTFIQNVIVGLKDEQGKVNLDKRILSVLTAINSNMEH